TRNRDTEAGGVGHLFPLVLGKASKRPVKQQWRPFSQNSATKSQRIG
ncbi:hypothetical protein ABIB80_006663, partial [Bradyrhizobium sp. i1.15.2]